MMATTKKKSSLPVLWIGAGLLVLLAVIAVIATSGGDDDGDGGDGGGDGGASLQETAAVSVEGTALPELADPRDDPAVGQPAPTVTGQSFDGTPVTVGGAGEPQLIFFLAHWCPHCQAEVPVVTEWLADEGEPEGVRLVAVSTGVNTAAPNYPPSEWLLEDEEWPIPTMVDDPDSTTAGAYGLSGFPFYVAVDADGNVVARQSGELAVAQLAALVGLARG